MASRSIKGAASNNWEAECECSSTLCLHQQEWNCGGCPSSR